MEACAEWRRINCENMLSPNTNFDCNSDLTQTCPKLAPAAGLRNAVHVRTF